MPHTPGSATYPTSTLPPDPYPKMPLSGAPTFTAEPQELPMQPTSLGPSVQLPLTAHDPHHAHHTQHHAHHHHHPSQPPPPQPPIRTQFATYTSAAPHHLSLSSAGTATSPDNSLAVPRYIGDTNPRPSKSPRHASHQSITSSLSTDTAPGEYRYGPAPTHGGQGQQQQPSPNTTTPTTANTNTSAYAAATGSPQQQGGHATLPPPISQQQQPSQGSYAPEGGSGQAGNAQTGATAGRDYYPASQGWSTGAGGEGAAGGDRPYGYPAAGAAGVKGEQHHAGGAQAGQGYGYASWNAA